MPRSRSLFGVPSQPASPEHDVPVEELDGLGNAVVSDGLLLITNEDRLLSLYAVAGGRARALVTAADAVSVWQALDALDLASLETDRRGEDQVGLAEAA